MVYYCIFDKFLKNFIFEYTLEVNFKNVKFDFMDYLPAFKKGITCNINKNIKTGSLWIFLGIYCQINGLHSIDNDKKYKNHFCYYDGLGDFILEHTIISKYNFDCLDTDDYINELILLRELNTVLNSIPKGIYFKYYELDKILITSIEIGNPKIIKILNKNINVRLINIIINGDNNMIIDCLNLGACPFIGYIINPNNQYIKFACIKKSWLSRQALHKSDSCPDVNNLILVNLYKSIV